jgi:hypothetical protein
MMDQEVDRVSEVRTNWRNQLRTLHHAYTEREPTRYIVDKFFEAGSLNIVYGAPAVMKSMLVADMCACIVAGQEWLPGCMGGGDGIPVEQGAILWLDMDNGKRRTDERIDALGKARKLPPDAPVYYLSMPIPPLMLNDIDALIALVEMARDDLHVSTIVVDNLGLITGDVEENSAGMAQVMGYMRILAERTNAAVILIHHQRKGGANGGRAGDALRGHSSIEAAVDLALQIVREPGEKEVTIQSTKTRGVDVPTVSARFNYEHRPGTNDLAMAWFDGVEGVRGANPVRMVILQVLADYPQGITKGRLVDVVQKEMGGDVGVNKIRNWIADMIGVTGEIDERIGNNNAKILVLND